MTHAATQPAVPLTSAVIEMVRGMARRQARLDARVSATANDNART